MLAVAAFVFTYYTIWALLLVSYSEALLTSQENIKPFPLCSAQCVHPMRS